MPSADTCLRGFPCRILAIGAAFVLGATPAPADPGRLVLRPHFERFSPPGFERLVINAMAEDRHGFLWFGTNRGLVRFDGHRQRLFSHDPEDPGSPPSNEIADLLIDRAGDLWLATPRGVVRFDETSERFEAPAGPPLNQALDLLEDRQGRLWAATDNGLAVRTPATGEWSFLTAEDGLTTTEFRSLYEDPEGRLWVGGGDMVHLLEGDRFTAIPYPSDRRILILCFLADEAGELWVGTNIGLARFDRQAGELVTHSTDPTGGTGDSALWAMEPTGDGRIWLAWSNLGLVRFDPRSAEFESFAARAGPEPGLVTGQIRKIFRDRSQIYWFGGAQGEMTRLDPALQGIQIYGAELEAGAGPVNNLHGLCGDTTARFWVGGDRGLLEFDGATGGLVRRYSAEDPGGRSLPSDWVFDCLVDSSGDLWVATQGGLARQRRSGEGFETYPYGEDVPGALIRSHAAFLHETPSGVLWVGTSGDVHRFDRRSNLFERFPWEVPGSDATHLTTIRILEDRQGRQWFAAYAGGLFYLDPDDRVIRQLVYFPDEPDQPSSRRITDLVEDADGNLWLAVFGAGLRRLGPDRREWVQFDRRDGLPSEEVHTLELDAAGYLWVWTAQGLCRFDPRAETCQAAGGGPTPHFTIYAHLVRGADGRLWAPTVRHLAVFDPAEMAADSGGGDSAAPVLTGLKLFNTPVPVAADEALLPRPLHLVDGIELTHRQNVVTLEFAGLRYRGSDEQRFRYRLEGFDRDWLVTDSPQPSATYTNLDPGAYTFRVNSATGNGGWDPEGASLAVRVKPPPWRTLWAYGAYLVVLVGAIGAFYGGQRRKLEREQEVNRQLREVDRLKDEFLANTSHELRTPLYGITGLAESLIDGATGELPEATRANLEMIVSSGHRLSHLVSDILDFSKLRHKDLDLDRKAVDLRPLVEVVLTLSRPLVGAKNLLLVNAVPTDLPAADGDENRLQQILYNLVGNAIKFTASGSVEVTAGVDGDNLVVRVADTGIGIAADQQEEIFDLFVQADTSVEREYGGTGLGLAVTRQLVELHGGSIWLDSTPGEGTTFSFSLPKRRRDRATADTGTAVGQDIAPLRVEKVRERPGESPGGSVEEAGAGDGDFHILVVDDEPVNRQVLSNYLSFESYRLTLAGSGDEALRALEERKFDLVLLDIMMPKVSGYEVCRVLRERYPVEKLPVIFLTAKNQARDVVTGLSLGANDFLVKPISRSELLARMRPHLDLLSVNRNLEGLVREKMSQVKVLQGLLPICSGCKKIRDDGGYWSELEVFIDAHSEAAFTHGMCPDCVVQYHERRGAAPTSRSGDT